MIRKQHCCVFFCICFIYFFASVLNLFASPNTFTGAAGDSFSAGKNSAKSTGIKKTAGTNSQSGGASRTATAAELQALADIEKGTPASLRSAASRIRQQGKAVNEREKLLLYVATSIYTIVYPSERLTWELPELTENSIYRSSIESAKMGSYDFNNEKSSDYLTLVLPSLLLFTAPNVKNYYTEAQISLTKAMEVNPNAILAPYFLGTIYSRQGKYQQAVKPLETAYKIQSDCVPVATAYIQALLSLGRAKDAYNAGVKSLLKNNNNRELLTLCAQSAFEMNDWELADQYVSQVLQSDSTNAQCQLMRARILLEQGDYLRASAALDLFSRNEKPNREYYLVRLRLLQDWNKNMNYAATTATEALQKFPNDTAILLAAAGIASESGIRINDLTASQMASKILGEQPDNADAMVIMVKEAIKNEQWQTAYNNSAKLLQIRSDDQAKLLRIDACLGLGKYADAKENAQILYGSRPQNEEIQIMYIRTLIATKSGDEALKLIESLLPNAAQKTKSALYYQRSRLAASDAGKLNDLRSSLTSNPRNEAALYDLYRYYYKKQDYKKAQYYLRQVIAIKPSDQKLLNQQNELEKLLAN